MRRTIIHAVFLIAVLIMPLSSAIAYEKIINFDSGVPSGVGLRGDTVGYVPSILPSGTGNALQCTTGSGSQGMYCGLYVSPLTPITNDIYVRYYIRFLPGWRFGAGGSQFKAIIFNPQSFRSFVTLETGSNPSVGQLVWDPNLFNCPDTGSPWYASRCASTGFIPADGTWHLIEARMLRNGATGGAIQIWLDSALVLNRTGIDAGSTAMNSIELGYQNSPSTTGGTMQYEDVVIADHYVGPNGQSGGDVTAPAAPQGLSVS